MKSRCLTVIAAVAAILLAFSCKGPVQKYTDWLYEYMPLPDSLHYGRDYWESNVAKTLEVRDRMAWSIPEREFRHFVLPLRVNNETLDDFRTKYADTLCARVAGMSLAEAALEINHWCHEQATYQPSDGRTGGPESIMLRGLGRCGEESVLAVAALRAAGIPARQVYTPRWAHTDDNHAWVEVWVDGGWHFMGACEPEAVLDRAWFNGAVSRAMILHTKVYGDYDGPEDVIQRTPCYTEINVVRNYVPVRRTAVTVMSDGAPVEGASVSFRIYNYAEFYDVVTYKTGADGRAALDTGLGDMFVLAWKDGRFGYAVASSEDTVVELNHSFGDVFCDEIDIVPPVEDPLAGDIDPALAAANAVRLAAEDSIRLSHDHTNHAVALFREVYPGSAERVLGLLSEKDLADVSYDVLEDAIIGVGSQRVELEHLRPYRAEILASGELDGLHNADDVRCWCDENITVVEGRNPQSLRTSPIAVWRSRKTDGLGLKIFYVALCRTLGIDAAYDLVTGEVAATAPQALLHPASDKYFRDYTLTQITPEGETKLLDYESGLPEVLSVDEGYYLLTTGLRLSDGSVLARLEFFNVAGGEERELVPVVRKSALRPAVLGSMDPEAQFVPDGTGAGDGVQAGGQNVQAEPQSLISATGRGWFLLAFMGHRDEPTSHASTELEAAARTLNDWGRPVVVLGQAHPSGLHNAVFGKDLSILETLPGEHKLPVIALCDSFGRIVYLSEGYNTSLAADLERIVPLL
ncbi:MAG: transglutaminase domain-containing protein [Bacteroidales bacterium]|nr:transglutaminase domain-containing protein [Bacteroidales bacterium]